MPPPTKQMQSAPSDMRKRRAYTTVACERCQRRKIKCSGGQPCQRCQDGDMACSYPRTTRFRTARRESTASSQAGAARGTLANDAPTSPSQANPDSSINNGPLVTQDTNGNNLARPLESMIPGSFDYYIRLAESRFAAAKSPKGMPKPPTGRSPVLLGTQRLQDVIACRSRNPSNGNVLELLELDTWSFILQWYDEEIGMQYPFLDIESLNRRIRAASKNKCRHDRRIEDIACLILSVVASLEDSTGVETATPLVHDIFSSAIVRVHTSTDNVDDDDIYSLILCSIFFFLTDREIQAWKCIGTVMRLLHEISRYDSGNQVVPDAIYWTVYTLDRRWSFGTGLPFAVSDSDIIISRSPLLQDDQSLSSAYLKQMVAYCKIASEVRRTLLDQPQPSHDQDTAADFAHFRVIQWQNNLSQKLRFRGVDDKFDPSLEKRGEYKLRLMLYLRANQMRTIILRRSAPLTAASDSIDIDDASGMQTMLDIAQDTIRILVYLGRETDIYRAQHRTFNHFLETALSSLLLVACRAGLADTANAPSYLDDVVAAIDLIRQLSQQSEITRKLHEKLQVIQQAVDSLKPPRSDEPTLQRLSLDCPPVPGLDADSSRTSTDSASNNPPSNPPNNPSIPTTEPWPVDFNLSLQDQNRHQLEKAVSATSSSASYQGFGPYPQPTANMAPVHMTSNENTSPYNFSSMSDNYMPSDVMGGGAMAAGAGTMMPEFDGSLLRELNDVLMDYEQFAF